jgi:hypothetical protein
MHACRFEACRLGHEVAWGQTGPLMLTAVLQRLGLLADAAPARSCYPLDWTQTPMLFDPGQIADVRSMTDGAIALHLWNEMLRRAGVNKSVGVPEGSFLDTLFTRHGVQFPAYPRYTAEEIRHLDTNRLHVDHARHLLSENADLRRQLSDLKQRADDRSGSDP